MKEREERRKNVVIRGMKVGKNEMKKKIKEALTEIGVDTDVNYMKIVEGGKDGGVRMAVIGL